MGKKKEKSGKSQNRGLPGKIIKSFGQPVAWKMITEDTWNEFYKSDAGQKRLEKLITKQNDRAIVQTSWIEGTEKPKPLKTEDELNAIRASNAAARIKARTKKRKVVK